MENFKNDFIQSSIRYGEYIEEGDHKSANKLHSQLTNLYKNIKDEESWYLLKEMISHENDYVKLWSATLLLKNDSELAIKVLANLQESEKIIGLTAATTIDLWKKGLLQL